MPRTIISEGKTSTEAIEKGLKELRLTRKRGNKGNSRKKTKERRKKTNKQTRSEKSRRNNWKFLKRIFKQSIRRY